MISGYIEEAEPQYEYTHIPKLLKLKYYPQENLNLQNMELPYFPPNQNLPPLFPPFPISSLQPMVLDFTPPEETKFDILDKFISLGKDIITVILYNLEMSDVLNFELSFVGARNLTAYWWKLFFLKNWGDGYFAQPNPPHKPASMEIWKFNHSEAIKTTRVMKSNRIVPHDFYFSALYGHRLRVLPEKQILPANIESNLIIEAIRFHQFEVLDKFVRKWSRFWSIPAVWQLDEFQEILKPECPELEPHFIQHGSCTGFYSLAILYDSPVALKIFLKAGRELKIAPTKEEIDMIIERKLYHLIPMLKEAFPESVDEDSSQQALELGENLQNREKYRQRKIEIQNDEILSIQEKLEDYVRDWQADLSSYGPIVTDAITFEKQIGKGAFGEVYRGSIKGKPVAVKELFPSTSSASEIQVLASNRHKNTANLIGIQFTFHPKLRIVTPLYHPHNLSYRLRKHLIEPSAKQEIALQIISAVCYLHEKKIVHGDLQSRNVLFESESNFSTLKLVDYGLSGKHMMDRVNLCQWITPPEGLTFLGYSNNPHSIGTLAFTEDIYALGIIFWELLVEESIVHYKGMRLPEFVQMVVSQKKLKLEIPEQLAKFSICPIIRVCTSHAPTRFQSANKLKEYFLQLISQVQKSKKEESSCSRIEALEKQAREMLSTLDVLKKQLKPETK